MVESISNSSNCTEDASTLVKAINLLLADRNEIAQAAISLHKKFVDKYHESKTPDEILDLSANKIIANYSYYTAFVGAATGLAGAIPGLGTVLATFGGATADIALTMKYQVEMTMAIAVIYNHDILNEDIKNTCFMVSGLGIISKAAQDGGKRIGSKAFIKLVQQHLKGPLLQAIKELFKKIGITFTRKSLEKAIPFGIGSVIGFTANKGLTWYVGHRAKDFFKAC